METESSGVLVWWSILAAISVVNLGAWALVARQTAREHAACDPEHRALRRWLIVLSAMFVLGCAFRSFLPRVEAHRICLYDSWISSAMVTRAVATVAELSLVAQWALLLSRWAREEGAPRVAWVARLLLPLIATAETFSWYTTLTTNYLGSVIEESLWALCAALMTPALFWLSLRCEGGRRRFTRIAAVLASVYVAFMCTVDVPMYLSRWRNAEAQRASYLTVSAGLLDSHTRSVVTRRWEDWRDEIPWMSLYFTVGVWVSISLIRAPLHTRVPRAAAEPVLAVRRRERSAQGEFARPA